MLSGSPPVKGYADVKTLVWASDMVPKSGGGGGERDGERPSSRGVPRTIE